MHEDRAKMGDMVDDGSFNIDTILFNNKTEVRVDNIVTSFQKLYLEKKKCDITVKFQDGSAPIHAHKIVLSMTSEVIEEMLLKQDEITVSDPPQMFKWLVNQAYTGHILVTDDVRFWAAICKMLDKYKMASVKQIIMKRLKTFITERNLNELYQSDIVKDCEIIGKCKSVIASHGWKMISEAGKRNLSPYLISEILDLDLIRLSEEELFRILVAWAKLRLSDKFLMETGQHLRNEMEPFLGKILFTKLDFTFIMKEVVPLDIFTQEEICSLLQYMHRSTSWKSHEVSLPSIFCSSNNRSNYNVTDISIYNIVKTPFCGPFYPASSQVSQLLCTIVSSEDIHINGINGKACCFIGYFRLCVEDPITRTQFKTGSGPMWRFASPFKVLASTHYKFYVEGNGRLSNHKFTVYGGVPNNIEMYGETITCHVAIHFT